MKIFWSSPVVLSPAQDYDFLYKAGVVAIFGPGTSVAKAAVQIMDILLDEEELSFSPE